MNLKYKRISLLCLGHFLIDFISIYLLNTLYHHYDFQTKIIFFIVYNVVAFGFQIIVGYIADVGNHYKSYIFMGLIIGVIALNMKSLGLYSILFVAIGNAIYHIGGGVKSLQLFPGKSAPAGIFVAPGAIGVFLGYQIASQGFDISLYLTIVTAGLILLMYYVYRNSQDEIQNLNRIHPKFTTILLGIFIIVFVRGFIGMNLIFPWKSNMVLSSLLVGGVFIGKFLGGVLGDRFGFKKIGIGGLVLSLPFLLLGYYYSIFGIVGALLFNLTMAITLYIVVNSMGRYQGFAFGITTLALLLSYLPGGFGFTIEYGIIYHVSITILVTLGALFIYYIIDIYEKRGELDGSI